MALVCLTIIAACGGPVPVRQEPQAVHPGTSPLAQGRYAAPTDHYAICTANPRALCHIPVAGDGSSPIID